MVDLDNLSVYGQLDRSGMLGHLHAFARQCHRAWEQVLKLGLPSEYSGVSNVVIVGMGGSAIGGDIARRLAQMESRVPVWVHRDYGLPAFVDRRTLVVASSYSGNTEETLSAFGDSLKRQAKQIVVTSGGRLGQMADREGIPAFVVDYRAPPRAAFPYNFVPLIGILQKLGFIADKSADVDETVSVLEHLSDDLIETKPCASNPAKQLASMLSGRVAVVYGAEILTEVAQRWKTQFNENSKSWSFFEGFPELNHNAVLGYDFPAGAKNRLCVLLLRSALFGPRTLLRYRATTELLSGAGISHQSAEARGKSTLAQIMSLVLLGDYVSFYLAMLNGIDPTSIDAIDFVKRYLSRSDTSGD